jgi:hypothetical protein
MKHCLCYVYQATTTMTFFWSCESFPLSSKVVLLSIHLLSHFLLLSAALYISNFFKFIWNEFNNARFSPQNGFNFSIIYNHLIIYLQLLTLAMFIPLFRHFWKRRGFGDLTGNCSVGNVCCYAFTFQLELNQKTPTSPP